MKLTWWLFVTVFLLVRAQDTLRTVENENGESQHQQQQQPDPGGAPRHQEVHPARHDLSPSDRSDGLPPDGALTTGGVDTAEDLKKRIEALELLVSEQASRRSGGKMIKEAIRVIEKGIVQSVGFVKNKIEQGAPHTDEECGFDYIVGRCTPVCDCNLQPKLGDYSLGRACRFIDKLEIGVEASELVPPCDPDEFDTKPWVRRFSRRFMRVLKNVIAHIKEHAPPTDTECTFEWLHFKCKQGCEFSYQYGDYSLTRACRLKVEMDDPLEKMKVDEEEVRNDVKTDGNAEPIKLNTIS